MCTGLFTAITAVSSLVLFVSVSDDDSQVGRRMSLYSRKRRNPAKVKIEVA